MFKETTVTNPQFATLATAAEVAGVSTKTIRRYISSGRITGYRMGPRMIRVDIRELQQLLAPIPVTSTEGVSA